MGLIDSHAHLTYPGLVERIPEVLGHCDQAGVDAVITIGTRLTDAREAIELARRYPSRVYAAAAFHPHEADKVGAGDIDAMSRLWAEPEIVAIGEIGLDHHYDFADRVRQREVFARQLSLAAPINKPIIIHCREALDNAVPMLVAHGFRDRRVVFHCFTGTADEAGRIAEHGWRISFTGIVTFPKSQALQEIARTYPSDRIMVETDSPYLSPVPVRGKQPCEPAYVAHTARFLAELRGTPYDAFVAQTTGNTRTFFGLPS